MPPSRYRTSRKQALNQGVGQISRLSIHRKGVMAFIGCFATQYTEWLGHQGMDLPEQKASLSRLQLALSHPYIHDPSAHHS